MTAGLALTGPTAVGGPAAVAPPGNDNIAGAAVLTPNIFTVGSTDEATLQPGEDRGAGNAVRTVWYRYTPSADRSVRFQTRSPGDNVDTFLTLYSGPAGATAFTDLTELDHNDNGAGLLSLLPADLTGATTYFLQVDTHDATVPLGDFGVRVFHFGPSLGPPPNDNLAGAVRLLQGIGPTIDLRVATTEATEPQQAGCTDPIRNSAWYHYTPTIARSLRFGTAGATDSVVNVYRGPLGATAGQLTAVGCDDDPNGDSSVTVAATAGTRYYVQIGSSTPAGDIPTLFVDQDWNEPSKVTVTTSLTPRSLTLNASAVVDPYLGHVGPFPALTGFLEVVEAHTSLTALSSANGTTGSLTIPRPTSGDHTYIVMFHSGSEDYPDAYRSVEVSVPKLASTTKVKAPKRITVRTVEGKHGKPVIKAKRVRVKAVVTNGDQAPTGQVVFKVGKKTMKTTLANGVAKIRVKLKRTTKVTITYAGDANTTGSSAEKRIKVVVEKP